MTTSRKIWVTGAVAFHNDRPNPTYRSFVQRCLVEKGFDVIGWN